MTWAIPRPGLHAMFDGREYPIDADADGWFLWSADEADLARGFRPKREGLLVHPIRPGDKLEAWERSYRGTYRGLPVSVSPNAIGTLMLVTDDPSASNAGFSPLDRSSWANVVPPDDPELSFEEIRTPASPRWETSSGEAQ